MYGTGAIANCCGAAHDLVTVVFTMRRAWCWVGP